MKLTVLSKDQLIPYRWYVGRGRTSNVALYDEENFLTIADKGGQMVVKVESYYEAEEGCFQPFLLVDEGKMIEPFGKLAWDAHYGKTLEFGATEPTEHSQRLRSLLIKLQQTDDQAELAELKKEIAREFYQG